MNIPQPTLRPDEGLIFIHIPKTAGSTLHRIIYRHYPADALYHTDRYPHGWRTFTQWPSADRAKIRLLMGHIEIGSAVFVPRFSHYFTMLRDPIQRAISYYGHVCRVADHYCHDLVQQQRMSLADFARSGLDVMMDNGQTRMLAGVLYDIPCGQLTAAVLDEAKKNLEQCLLVGLAEQFDQSLLLMGWLFGWHNLFYARRNVSPKRVQPDADTLAALAQVNHLDQALYAHGADLLAQQWARWGSDAALRRFQWLNRLLRPFYHYGSEIKQRLTGG
jgi:hypothetical protein